MKIHTSEVFLEYLYRVVAFPAWVMEKNRRKWLRFIGILFALPWFVLLSPVGLIGIAILAFMIIWEDC